VLCVSEKPLTSFAGQRWSLERNGTHPLKQLFRGSFLLILCTQLHIGHVW